MENEECCKATNIIKELNYNDLLNDLKNKNKAEYVACLVNIRIWQTMDKNDIAEEKVVNIPNQPPQIRKIKVKDILPLVEQRRDNLERVLSSIEHVRLNLSNK